MDEKKKRNVPFIHSFTQSFQLVSYCFAIGILLFWRMDSNGMPSAEQLPVLTHVLHAFTDAKWQTAGDLRATHLWPARTPATHYAARGT